MVNVAGTRPDERVLAFVVRAAFIAALSALAGCTLGIRNDGPLGGPSPVINTACGPTQASRHATFGVEFLHNSGRGPVEISSVEFENPNNLTINGAWLVPIVDNNGIGFGAPEPAKWVSHSYQKEAWAQRQDAIGAEIAAGKEMNLVLDVTYPDSGGTADRIVVGYKSGGIAYSYGLSVKYVMKPKCF